MIVNKPIPKKKPSPKALKKPSSKKPVVEPKVPKKSLPKKSPKKQVAKKQVAKKKQIRQPNASNKKLLDFENLLKDSSSGKLSSESKQEEVKRAPANTKEAVKIEFEKKSCARGWGADKFSKKELFSMLDRLGVGYSRYENKVILCKRIRIALDKPVQGKPEERKVAVKDGIFSAKVVAPSKIDWSRCRPGNAKGSYKSWEIKALLKKHGIVYKVNDPKRTLCRLLAEGVGGQGKAVLPADARKAVDIEAKQPPPYKGTPKEIVARINTEISKDQWRRCGKGNGKHVWPRKDLERWLRSLRLPFRVNDHKGILCEKLREMGVNL
jgi:hypothetical protein